MARSTHQTTAALSMYRSGTCLILFGFIWGVFIPSTPFPKLALLAHTQSIESGFLILLAGMLTEKSDLIRLSEMQSKIIYWAMNTIWPAIIAQVANAWWGTNQMLPIAAERAKATGGTAAQELVVTLVFVVQGPSMVASFGILVWALFKADGEKKED